MRAITAKLAALSVASLLILTGCADNSSKDGAGQTFRVKLSESLGKGVPSTDASDWFAEEVTKRSGGRVKFDIYPNSQLGTAEAINNGLQDGSIEMAFAGWSYMSQFANKARVFNLPLLFPDRAAAYKVMDGAPGREIAAQLESVAGVKSLAFYDGGFASPANNVRPVATAADLRGLKMRIINNPLIQATYNALNTTPIALDFTELRSALDSGTVDGYESTPTDMVSGNLGPVTKYYTETYQNFFATGLFVNAEFFNSLPDDLKKIFTDVGREAAERERKAQEAMDKENLGKLASQGVKISQMSDAAKAEMRTLVEPAYGEATKTLGADFIKSVQDVIAS